MYDTEKDIFNRSLILKVQTQTEETLGTPDTLPRVLSIPEEDRLRKESIDLYLERLISYLLHLDEGVISKA
jgi:hypothetical protein